jgi:1,4-dihydroxy-2-naphthoate octaprenyltransferase
LWQRSGLHGRIFRERILERRAWFVRLVVPWALVPITWQGWLFEIFMIVVAVGFGDAAGRHLRAGNTPLGNLFVFMTFMTIALFMAFGIYKSRSARP